MRAVIQRTMRNADVSVNGIKVSEIEKGLIVYLGIGKEDNKEDLDWLAKKIVNLRIFNDSEGKMNISLKEIKGQILLISQFTLFADIKKGNRPSYIRSADPELAVEMYEQFAKILTEDHGIKPQMGVFGAEMKVYYINDGPVTIFIDSKQKSL